MADEDLGFVHHYLAGEDRSTLLLLHGTGGSEADLLQLGHTLAPGATLLSPRGKVLENGMPRFFRRLSEGVFDIEDLKRRTHELADFVEAAVAYYGLDAGRIIAVGYSNGANIAASTLLLRPGVLQAAVLLRAMLPSEPDTTPDLKGVGVFMASGRYDPLVPQDNVERLATMLRDAGADLTLHWQNTGHRLEHEEIDAARAWLSHFSRAS